jgi:CRP-like cAMP-binding protein
VIAITDKRLAAVQNHSNLQVSLMPGSKLPPELQEQLRGVGTPVAKERGAVLFRAGQAPRGAFVLRTGQLRLTLSSTSELYPARTVGPGSVVGLPATFSGEPYSLTAEATQDCTLDFVPRRKLLELLRSNPAVGFQIVRILSEEIFQMRKSAGSHAGPARGRPRRGTHPRAKKSAVQ